MQSTDKTLPWQLEGDIFSIGDIKSHRTDKNYSVSFKM